MDRWSVPMAALFVATMLAGCTSDDPTADTSETDDVTGGADAPLGDADEDDGPPMLPAPPDLWGDETELVLVDDTFRPEDSGFYPACSRIVFFGFFHCATVTLPEGTLVPHGTASLVVDVDAGSAQGAGDLGAEVFQTAGRTSATDENLRGDSQSGTQPSWTFDLEPRDWDPPTAPLSELQINVWNDGVAGSGVIGTHTGSFQVTVTAHRDPDWEPVSPGPDLWFDHPARVGPDAIQLLDENRTETLGGYTNEGRIAGLDVRLDHPIPPSATHVLLGASYNGLACAPASECFLVADTRTEDGGYYQPHGQPEHEPDWSIITILLPNPGLQADTADAEEPATWFWMYAHQCDPVMGVYQSLFSASSCLPKFTQSTTDLRVHVEAWRTEPDLDAFKERMGI